MRTLLPLLIVVVASTVAGHAHAAEYRLPPQAAIDIIDAPRLPAEFPSPDHQLLLIAQDDEMRSIEELTRPYLKFAGMRVFPNNNSQVRTQFYREPFVLRPADGMRKRLEVPSDSMLGLPLWSYDSRFVALPRYTDAGVELWVADTRSGKAVDATGPVVNATLSEGYRQIQTEHELNASWAPDNRHVLVFLIDPNRGAPPAVPQVPPGPIVMDTAHNFSRERSWEDLSTTPHDEALFEYYCTAQMFEIDATSGERKAIGPPGLYIAPPAVSPDGRYILMQRVKRPYSYWVRYREFSVSIEIWDRQGQLLRVLADLPSTDHVAPGQKRSNLSAFEWQAGKPATLVWIEDAPDRTADGSPADENRLMKIAAPFSGAPEIIAGSRSGFDRFTWLAADDWALVTESTGTRQWKTSTTYLANINRPVSSWRRLFDYVDDDREAHPGDPVERFTTRGERVAIQDGPWIYLSGVGGSPQGDRPFLDKVHLETRQAVRLFRSREGSHETFVAFSGSSRTEIVIGHETRSEPRGLRRLNTRTQDSTLLTETRHPYPQFKSITKQIVTYPRADGVRLSGTLYLPGSYRTGDRLPLAIWAYPTAYADRRVAGQVRAAADSFTDLQGEMQRPLRWFATQGYAVLDMAEMPVIGDPKTKNDTYIEQIVASARAAIVHLDAMGIVDPARVGMAGHSYGGFSTANLLANSDLFAAGIATSGAHNRTLDPWGFHDETRTLWQARELYLEMSPLMQANRITAPILLIHGEEDDSQSSKPIQSYRMFHALRGHGAIARLVFLPHENHRYVARQSRLHVAAEMIEWFDRYVKNREPR